MSDSEDLVSDEAVEASEEEEVSGSEPDDGEDLDGSDSEDETDMDESDDEDDEDDDDEEEEEDGDGSEEEERPKKKKEAGKVRRCGGISAPHRSSPLFPARSASSSPTSSSSS